MGALRLAQRLQRALGADLGDRLDGADEHDDREDRDRVAKLAEDRREHADHDQQQLSGSTTDSTISPKTATVLPRSVRTAAVRRCATSSGLSPLGRLAVRSQTTAGGSA